MKLYELSEAFHNVSELFNDGMIDQQAFTDTIEQIEIDLEEKIKNCVMMYKQHQANIQMLNTEIERLGALATKEEHAAEWLENYIAQSMLKTNKDRFDLGLFKLTLKQPTKKTNIIDESKIPSDFWVTIPESKRVDKSALLAALKLGEVEWAELVDGKRALIIK